MDMEKLFYQMVVFSKDTMPMENKKKVNIFIGFLH